MTYERPKTYQQEYDEFWKSIVENEDGTGLLQYNFPNTLKNEIEIIGLESKGE